MRLLAGIFALVCCNPAWADVSVRLQRLADVPVPKHVNLNQAILTFSPNGRDLLVESVETSPSLWGMRPDPLDPSRGQGETGTPYRLKAVLSLSTDLTTVTLTETPRSDGAWVAKDGTILATQALRRFHRVRPEVSAFLRDTRVSPAWGGLQFKRTVPKAEALGDQRAVFAPDGVRFEDADGIPLFSWQQPRTYDPNGGWCNGTVGLFVVTATTRTEVTLPNPYNGVTRISYDSIKHRLLAKGGPKGVILFEVSTGRRRLLPESDGMETHYFLLPGHDALLVHKNRLDEEGSDYLDAHTYLSDLGGNIALEVPAGPFLSLLIACSQHMVVFPVTTEDRKVAFRVFTITERSR